MAPVGLAECEYVHAERSAKTMESPAAPQPMSETIGLRKAPAQDAVEGGTRQRGQHHEEEEDFQVHESIE